MPEPVSAREYYLKSYIGITTQEIDDFTNEAIRAGDFTIVDHDFDSSPFIGGLTTILLRKPLIFLQ